MIKKQKAIFQKTDQYISLGHTVNEIYFLVLKEGGYVVNENKVKLDEVKMSEKELESF